MRALRAIEFEFSGALTMMYHLCEGIKTTIDIAIYHGIYY